MIINLPKLGPVNFRDDLSPEQLQAQLEQLQKKYDFRLPKPDVGIGTLLKRGFMRGLGETGIALGDVLPAMGASALGFEDYAKRQMGEAEVSRAELEKQYPTQFKSYTEITSPYEALQYAAETLGELGPTALTTMVPGVGAGAVGARLAGTAALRAAQSVGPVSRAGLAAVEKAAETAGRRAMYGGVYFGSFAQNAPEVFENIYQQTDKFEPGLAALTGGLSAVLDSVVPTNVLDKLGSYGKLKIIENMAKESGAAPKVWKAIGKEAAKAAGVEGLTEAAQESLSATAEQIAGSTKGVLDPENIQRYKESFVKGAVGGMGFGTVSGVSRGLTERKEYRNTKEAEAALQAQMEAERLAGTLTPEKRAEYDIAIENARKQREEELTSTFAAMPEDVGAVSIAALQERAEAIKEANPGAYERIYGELDKAVAANKAKNAEAEAKAKAKAEKELAKAEAEYAEGLRNKQAGFAFAKAEPTPGTGGMFRPGLEQQRMEQQAGLRQFAFGDTIPQRPDDPVTYETLQVLKIPERSKVAQRLLGVDLATPEGRRTFIQTLEDPSYTGNIDPLAYDDIISTFDQKEVDAARAEMRVEPISPTKQRQQEQTRAFAFGDPNASRIVEPTVGAGAGVPSESTTGAAPGTSEQTEPSGVVSTRAPAGEPAGGAGAKPAAVVEEEPAPAPAVGEVTVAGRQTPESDALFDEIRALEAEQKKLLTSAGRIPAVKSKARAKWDALGEQIEAKKDQWANLTRVTTPAPAPAPAANNKALFAKADELPMSEGVEVIREQWIGGVAGLGNRDPMYDLYRVEGGKEYTSEVQKVVRQMLGDNFKGYRLMSRAELEELETGAMGSDFASFTLDPKVAQAFKNLPAHSKNKNAVVVEMDLTPEHVVMLGHPGEQELVVNYGQGYNPSAIKVLEQEKAAPPAPAAAPTYTDQVVERYNALPGDQKDAVAARLGIPRAQVESEAITDLVNELDDAVAAVKRQARQTPPTAQGVTARPELPADLATVHQTLGARGAKLDKQAKDAKAYFGKVTPELALDAIAFDLVFMAKSAYRNANMTLPSATTKKLAETPEPQFGTKAEAEFFKGQGGVHAKGAEAWARANLSPQAVAFLDKKIAEYERIKQKSEAVETRRSIAQKARKDVEQQVADEAATAKAEVEAGRKAKKAARTEAKKAKKKAAKAEKLNLVKTMSEFELGVESDLGRLSDTDLNELLADADVAALQTQAHPVILDQLANNNLVGALQGLADTTSSEIVRKIATALARVVGDVKVVYGADRSMYDPKTNTIYLREGASQYEILHEATHAAVSHVLDNASHPVTREITALFNQLKNSIEGAYGAKDIQEFTAEAWSNEEFRNHLKTFKPDGQKFTGWERLVNAVRRMLGFSPKYESAYDKVDRLLNSIVSPPPETRTGETLYAQSLHVPNMALRVYQAADSTLAKIPHLTADRRAAVFAALEKMTMPMRNLFYKSLNLSAMSEVGTKYFGEKARQFSNLVNEMGGYQEKLLEAMQPLHQRLTDFRNSGKERYVEFSKLINDATIPDIRPYPESESMYRNTGKYAEYVALRNRFTRMTSEEQKLYRDYFATFKALDKEFEKSLKGNLEGAVGDKDKALSAYDKIMQELAALRIDHYAPLYREGIYWLTYEMNGTPVKRMFGTQVERTAAREQAKAQGATKLQEFSRVEQIDFRNVPDGTMLSSIMKIMKDSGAGEDDINKLIQLVVKALPETSILKSRQNRTGVAGYLDDNAAYVFDRVTSNSARQIARMRYGQQIKAVLAQMREDQAKLFGDESADARTMLNDLDGRYQFVMDPKLSNFSQYASSAAFYWNLAGNVSSAVVNLLQTPMVVFPQLGGKYGWGESTRALNDALQLYRTSGFSREVEELSGAKTRQRAMTSVENLINSPQGAKYKGLIEAMRAHGLLQTSTARDALQSENQNSSGFGGANKLSRVTTLVGTFMFHHAERFNREVTAVAAYDLELARLRRDKPRMSEADRQEAAIREAIRMVEYAHGAGSTLAGPSLGQSDIGKILMVFKRFAFSMYYMLFDTMRRSLPIPANATQEEKDAVRAARRQLVGIYGMAALFAGAKGLPMYWMAEMAYNMFQDDDEEDFDTVMRRYLGEFLFKGPVNYFTNLSIADRVGWTDLIFRENKGDRAEVSAITQFLEGMLGAPYSILKNFEKGFDLIADGHFYRGVEAMLPAAFKNIMKGGRYALEGANTLRGDPVMGDINGYNSMMQILGFAPADLMTQYEENAQITGRQKAIKDKEKKLLKQYYTARGEGDYERMLEAREKLFDLAAKYPEMGINEETISKSVTSRDRISQKMYHGVQLDDKLRARLEGAASTAFD